MKKSEIFSITFIDKDLPPKLRFSKMLLLSAIILILCYNIPTNAMGLMILLKPSLGTEIGGLLAVFMSALIEFFVFICFNVFYNTFSVRANVINSYFALLGAFFATLCSAWLSLNGLDDLNAAQLTKPTRNVSQIQAIQNKYDGIAEDTKAKFIVSESSTYDASIANAEDKIAQIEKILLQTPKTSTNKLRDLRNEKNRLENVKRSLFADKRSANKDNTKNLVLMNQALKDIETQKDKELATANMLYQDDVTSYQNDISKGEKRSFLLNIFMLLANILANTMFSLMDMQIARNGKKSLLWLFSAGLKNSYFEGRPELAEPKEPAIEYYSKQDYLDFFEKGYEYGMTNADLARFAVESMNNKVHRVNPKSIETYVKDWKVLSGGALLETEKSKVIQPTKKVAVAAEPVKVVAEAVKEVATNPIIDADTEEDLETDLQELKKKVLKLHNSGSSFEKVVFQLQDPHDGFSNETKKQIKHWIESEGIFAKKDAEKAKSSKVTTK